MRLFGFDITRTKAAVSPMSVDDWNRGWTSLLRESFAGAWQRGISVSSESVLTHATFFACVTLIAFDIAKLRIKLVAQDSHGIWTETDNPAFSPVLRKPNHFQTRIKFLEQWVLSKLIHGNTYVLKERDRSNKVRALYVLDPSRVKALVAPDGSVFYELSADHLSGLTQAVRVPASEIIHDVYVALHHPLCGVSPVTACGLAALQALKIQGNSSRLFENGSQVSGVLTAPGTIGNDTAKRIQEHWETNFAGEANVGKVAVLGDGLKFEPMVMTAVDAQLIDQLRWSDEKVCSVLHVPPHLVGVGAAPPYSGSVEALNQQYYAQCLQNPIECIEILLDEGLELPKPYGTELDVDGGLVRMDTSARIKAAHDAMSAGMAPNEVRFQFHGLGPVAGGGVPFMQEQNWPIALLAARELPMRPPSEPAPVPVVDDEDDEKQTAEFIRKALALGLPAPTVGKVAA